MSIKLSFAPAPATETQRLNSSCLTQCLASIACDPALLRPAYFSAAAPPRALQWRTSCRLHGWGWLDRYRQPRHGCPFRLNAHSRTAWLQSSAPLLAALGPCVVPRIFGRPWAATHFPALLRPLPAQAQRGFHPSRRFALPSIACGPVDSPVQHPEAHTRAQRQRQCSTLAQPWATQRRGAGARSARLAQAPIHTNVLKRHAVGPSGALALPCAAVQPQIDALHL